MKATYEWIAKTSNNFLILCDNLIKQILVGGVVEGVRTD